MFVLRWPFSPAISWAIATAFALVFFDSVVWWWVTDPFSGIAANFLTLVILVVGLLWTLIYGAKCWKKARGKSWLPLGIIFVACILIFFGLPRSMMIRANFLLSYNSRMEVMRLVETGKLRPDVSYNDRLIHLPDKYAALSVGDGNNIMVEHGGSRTTITFYTFLGILGHASGFMYKSDDSQPTGTDFEEEQWEVEKLRQHWFWIAD